MDGDRKYRQRGYQDSGYTPQNGNSERPRPQGPKLPLDITGPKLPRLVQSIAAARCHSCSVTLGPDTDFLAACPKCHNALHCCKQCVHFEPSTRFQCLKPIPVRIAVKDQANTCDMFRPRVTVARDGSSPSSAVHRPSEAVPAPRNANDARAAFDSLFKK
jgi:hypothetical protein